MLIQPIILRDKDSGAGQTGLAVKLFSKVDAAWTEYCGTTEVPNYPGVYLPDKACPYQAYRIKVNDVYDSSWDGNSDDGRMYGDVTDTINNAVNAEAVLRTNADALRVPLAGAAVITDLKQFRTLPQYKTSLGVTLVPVNEADAVPLKYLSNYIPYIYGLKLPAKVIVIDPSLAAEDDQHYFTIQAGINYAHAHNPGAAYDWHIYIAPGTYTENITMQPRVHLLGWGHVIINGILTAGNGTQHIKNITVSTAGNTTYSGIKATNCIFRIDNADTAYIMTLTSSKFNSCLFFNTGADGVEFKPTMASGGNNTFVGGCVSNLQVPFQASDIGKCDSLDSYSADFL